MHSRTSVVLPLQNTLDRYPNSPKPGSRETWRICIHTATFALEPCAFEAFNPNIENLRFYLRRFSALAKSGRNKSKDRMKVRVTFSDFTSTPLSSKSRMFNKNLATSSPFRDDLPTGDRKRRRTAVSCYDCRRRKLRCDRSHPSCGRCQKAGHPESCTYDLDPLAATIEEHSTLSAEEADGARTNASTTPSMHVPNKMAAVTSKQVSNDISSKILLQETKIAQLERRILYLERASSKSTGVWESLGRSPPATKLGERQIVPELDRLNTQQNPSEQNKTMLFKGKGFKTQFYGASNPASLFAHVCPPNSISRDFSDDNSSLNFGLS